MERLFSLASFEGLKLVRSYAIRYPDMPSDELLSMIERVDPDGASLDLQAGAHLHSIVDVDCPLANPIFYQFCIKVIIVRYQPIWAKAMRQGRKRFIKSLAQNDQDVFAAAGLAQDPPDYGVVSWWDDVAGQARLILDIQKMQQARDAEKMTFDHEVKLLRQAGIEKAPEWPGLDDNFAGYDILSYDNGPDGLINKMIEVKSTVASPLRFIVTRNEWETAVKVGSAYIFHVWDMARTPPLLYVRTADQIQVHIPDDNAAGRWTAANIPVGN